MRFEDCETVEDQRLAFFVSVTTPEFALDLCYEDIARYAPAEAVDLMMAMDNVPPVWFYWLLRRRDLDEVTVGRLLPFVIGDDSVVYQVIHDCQLNEDQINLLLTPPRYAYRIIRDCFISNQCKERLLSSIITGPN